MLIKAEALLNQTKRESEHFPLNRQVIK